MTDPRCPFCDLQARAESKGLTMSLKQAAAIGAGTALVAPRIVVLACTECASLLRTTMGDDAVADDSVLRDAFAHLKSGRGQT